MAIKFIQVNCREGNKIDPAQSRAILKYKPDIVIFEYPQENKTPDTVFNKFSPNKKPKAEFDRILRMLVRASKSQPWVLSDVQVFKNIHALWDEGKQVYLYFVDAPSKVTSDRLDEGDRSHKPFPKYKKYLWWWKKMYTRETCMTNHLKWVLEKHKNKNIKILIFLESFHWRHVQFRLKTKSEKRVFDYYFKYFRKYKNI